MENNKNIGYKSAFKTTAIFGGVEIITILVSVFRNKFAAIWIGAAGLGIMSLLNSLVHLVHSFSNLGLQSSAVKEIARVKGENDNLRLSTTIKSISWWVYIGSIVGVVLTILLSRILSRMMFNSSDYTIQIILVSGVVLIQALYRQNNAILQGCRRIKDMAKANVLASALSFIAVVPILYFFRIDGIASTIIISAVISFLVTSFFVHKLKLPRVSISTKDKIISGLPVVKLGIMMAISSMSAYLMHFITKIVITNWGDIADVGLYQAGWALNGHYLGMVFTAMSKDYFPRISQVTSDDNTLKKMLNEQAEIAVLILAPLIAGMVLLMPWCIKLLYSSEFLAIVNMASLLMIGSLIKAGSWAISYLFLAKGDGKTFMINEILSTILGLPLYLFGYRMFGLTGIGYAFIANYFLYFIIVCVVSKRKYNIYYISNFWKIFVLLIFSVIALYLSTLYLPQYVVWILAVLILLYSLYELDKRIDVFGMVYRIFKIK